MSTAMFSDGLDVHKDSVKIAVFRDRDPEPMRVDRLPFESPRQLMAYLGLAPGEHSSGDRRRLGAITEAGNARVRHVLVQAAWHDRRRPTVGTALRRRQEGQDPSVLTHAWKCQHRLYKLFHRLAQKKPKQVAATAVAREMVGFLWAVLREVDINQLQLEFRNQEGSRALGRSERSERSRKHTCYMKSGAARRSLESSPNLPAHLLTAGRLCTL
jgi:hypothetical protein